MYELLNRRSLPVSITLFVLGLSSFVLGCRQQSTPVESSRAMRIRLEVEQALDQMSHGASLTRVLSRLVPRINVELEREPNGLGEHFDTCQRLCDGLIELEQLQGRERDAKIEQLRGLASQLPEFQG